MDDYPNCDMLFTEEYQSVFYKISWVPKEMLLTEKYQSVFYKI